MVWKVIRDCIASISSIQLTTSLISHSSPTAQFELPSLPQTFTAKIITTVFSEMLEHLQTLKVHAELQPHKHQYKKCPLYALSVASSSSTVQLQYAQSFMHFAALCALHRLIQNVYKVTY